MDISVRGALGTQLFEYLSGITQAKKHNNSVSQVLINAGGRVVDTVKVDWLSQIILLDIPVKVVSGKAKQDVWKYPNLFKDLCINKSSINEIKLSRRVQKNSYKILHIRGIDRTVANVNDYVRMVHTIGPDVKLLGDDNLFINKIIKRAGQGQNISKSVLDDWYACIGCDELYCAFTNFTLSAMLFDPNKKFYMLDKTQAHGTVAIPDQTYNCVQQLFDNYFINANWMYKE
jgi:hypothetical protein